MKIKWLIVLLPVLVFAGVAGCKTISSRTAPDSLVPFTGKHMEDFSEYLEDIQFYISREIVLHRATEFEKKDVTGEIHTIQVEKKLKVQSITFPAKTPCVLFGIDGDTLDVQFEPARDGRNRTIPFRKRNLAVDGSNPENVVFVFDRENISYDGNEYKVYYEEEEVAVTEKDSAIYAEKARSEQEQYIIKKRFPILLINPVRRISRFNEENRVVPGVWKEGSRK